MLTQARGSILRYRDKSWKWRYGQVSCNVSAEGRTQPIQYATTKGLNEIED